MASFAESDIRKFAGHQNISTTMGYSRGSADAIARVVDMKKEDGDAPAHDAD